MATLDSEYIRDRRHVVSPFLPITIKPTFSNPSYHNLHNFAKTDIARISDKPENSNRKYT
jgi:hypothetical protein